MVTRSKMLLQELHRNIAEFLQKHHWHLAVAESCTGGLLGAGFTEAAGASEYFRGGVIAYENWIKSSVLGVAEESLETQGAVSGEVAEQMAVGVAKLMQAECALSITGVAGPGGGTEAKPVGRVFIGIYVGERVESQQFTFAGSRSEVRAQSCEAALRLLQKNLKKKE